MGTKGTFFAASASPLRRACQQHVLFNGPNKPLGAAAEYRIGPGKLAPRFLPSRLFFSSLLLMSSMTLSVCPSVTAEQESRAKYEAQFQLERDPVAKARILAKLGRLEIDQARADLKADKEEDSLADLEHYRDEVEGAVQALSATGVNAEQHPAGFKELQISLRETLRHIDELILELPLDKRPWFQAVRSDLGKSQNVLIEALFPTVRDKRSRKGDP